MYALCAILHNVCHIIHRHSMQLSTNLSIVNTIYAILVQNYLCLNLVGKSSNHEILSGSSILAHIWSAQSYSSS